MPLDSLDILVVLTFLGLAFGACLITKPANVPIMIFQISYIMVLVLAMIYLIAKIIAPLVGASGAENSTSNPVNVAVLNVASNIFLVVVTLFYVYFTYQTVKLSQDDKKRSQIEKNIQSFSSKLENFYYPLVHCLELYSRHKSGKDLNIFDDSYNKLTPYLYLANREIVKEKYIELKHYRMVQFQDKNDLDNVDHAKEELLDLVRSDINTLEKMLSRSNEGFFELNKGT